MSRLPRGLRPALSGWAVARVVVLLALWAASTRPAAVATWDQDWYADIAADGYAGSAREALRFFPLTPLLGRWIAPLVGGDVQVALIGVANVAALAYGVALWRLVRRDFGDTALADRSVLWLAVVPSGFVLAMGYPEALFGLLSVAFFMAVRSGRWSMAIALGVLAGLDRPLALLLLVPAAVDVALRWRRAPGNAQRAAMVGAVGAPLAGVAAFCAWVGSRFGDPMLPFTVQQSADLRAAVATSPHIGAHRAWLILRDPAAWPTDRLLLASGVVLVGLLVVAARRMPASYTAWAGVTLLAAMTSPHWGSLLRYAFSAFPFAIALAVLTARRRWAIAAGIASCVLLFLYAYDAFLGRYVP